IPLTVTANGKDAVKLAAGTYANTGLAPGYYKVVEVQNANDLKAWNAANEVYCTVYTNGEVELTENKGSASTITNSASASAGVTQGNSRSTHNFVEVPALDVTKTGTPNVSETGIMQISYTIDVTNTGNAALSQMVLNDAKFKGTVEVKKGDTAVSASLNGTELTVSDSLAVG